MDDNDDVATYDNNITVVHTDIIIDPSHTASVQLSHLFCQTAFWILTGHARQGNLRRNIKKKL